MNRNGFVFMSIWQTEEKKKEEKLNIKHSESTLSVDDKLFFIMSISTCFYYKFQSLSNSGEKEFPIK